MDANKIKKIKSYGKVSVVENYANQYAVTDCNGEIIVPFGKYGWIDGFDSGLARVRTPKDPGIANNVTSIILDLFGDDTKVISGKEDIRNAKDKRENPDKYAKWGIINEKGEEVLPVIYDEVWSFYGKNRYSTRVIKDGVKSDVYFHDLNPELPARRKHSYENSNKYDYDAYGTHYGEYAGTYAQDVMGYSDDVINDAFEGDPDAYWNID